MMEDVALLLAAMIALPSGPTRAERREVHHGQLIAHADGELKVVLVVGAQRAHGGEVDVLLHLPEAEAVGDWRQGKTQVRKIHRHVSNLEINHDQLVVTVIKHEPARGYSDKRRRRSHDKIPDCISLTP